MRLINADEHECWACKHHASGSCDTWCDHGESFEIRDDVAEAKTVFDLEAVIKLINKKFLSLSKLGFHHMASGYYESLDIIRKELKK